MANNGGSIGNGIAVFVGAVMLAVLLGLLLSYPVMLLWNACLVPATSAVREIEWLQAWGIMVLSSLLFKSSVSKS